MSQAELIHWDPGSFRDPAGHVFFHNQDVYRSLKNENVADIKKLLATRFFRAMVKLGNIIPTTLEENTLDIPSIQGSHILKHEKIPFITYPYEWSFYMLKDAALVTLKILASAIKEGFILKDGTAWNVTYHKGKMCFFDVLSIGPYQDGQMWEGYQQFCQQFLYPLMVKSYKDINFQSFFKGDLAGIPIHIMAPLFRKRDWLKPGVFKHVYLVNKFSNNKKIGQATVRKKYKLPKNQLLLTIEKLQQVIASLEPSQKHSVWHDYATHNTYEENDAAQKKTFVADAIKNCRSVVDIGCNTGDYSFQVPEAIKVFSCDLDSDSIDILYQKNKDRQRDLTPFVLDLMNPSPNCGWWLKERQSIFDRLHADGFLALALIHHICIAANVPLAQFVQFLALVAEEGVLEWVDKSDPMVQFLLRNREDVFQDYTWENFQNIVKQHFTIEKVETVNEGHRKLCYLKAVRR